MSEPDSEPTAKRPIHGLPRNIFFLSLTSLFDDFSSEMVFSVFPAFISVLKTGAGGLGLVDGIAGGILQFLQDLLRSSFR